MRRASIPLSVVLYERGSGVYIKNQSRKPHQHFLRGSMSALSSPKLSGDVKTSRLAVGKSEARGPVAVALKLQWFIRLSLSTATNAAAGACC